MPRRLFLMLDFDLPDEAATGHDFSGHWTKVEKGKFKGYHALKAVAYVVDSEKRLLGSTIIWGKNKSGDVVYGIAKGVFQSFDSRNGEYDTGFGDAYKAKAYLKKGGVLKIFVRIDGTFLQVEVSHADLMLGKLPLKEWVVVPSEDDPVVPEEPVPEPDVLPAGAEYSGVDLLQSFYKGSWVIAALLSMLLMKTIRRIVTHVTHGLSNSALDITADAEGLVFKPRSQLRLDSRWWVTYRIPLSVTQLEISKQVCAEEHGKKYNFFMYFRRFFNVQLILTVPLFVFGAIFQNWWIVGILLFIYIPLNWFLWKRSEKTWACSEFESYHLKKLGIDYLYKEDITADSQNMYEKTQFLFANSGLIKGIEYDSRS